MICDKCGKEIQINETMQMVVNYKLKLSEGEQVVSQVTEPLYLCSNCMTK